MAARFDVIGCKITQATFNGAIENTLARLEGGEGGYVCFTNVHVSVMAHDTPALLQVLNQSFMTLPDGKPVYWVGKLYGIADIQQIPGPDFLPAMLAARREPPLRHYFYGGRQDVVDQLVQRLKEEYPQASVVGWESPPFRELSREEDRNAVQRIRDSGADIVWVGLGAPKQEYWMASHAEQLKPAILMGVGAAFDFHAGNMKRAPDWMRSVGLEWLHRLAQEPGRLWKRYLVTNTLFLVYVFKGLFTK